MRLRFVTWDAKRVWLDTTLRFARADWLSTRPSLSDAFPELIQRHVDRRTYKTPIVCDTTALDCLARYPESPLPITDRHGRPDKAGRLIGVVQSDNTVTNK